MLSFSFPGHSRAPGVVDFLTTGLLVAITREKSVWRKPQTRREGVESLWLGSHECSSQKWELIPGLPEGTPFCVRLAFLWKVRPPTPRGFSRCLSPVSPPHLGQPQLTLGAQHCSGNSWLTGQGPDLTVSLPGCRDLGLALPSSQPGCR